MLSRNKTDENNMSELRMMKKQKLLILLMTTNESAEHNNICYTFQELSLFLIKYSFILYDNTIDRKFFKRVFYPHGEIFFQNSNGARYLDPKYSRWLSTDPALGEYVPAAGKGNASDACNLPGMGGIYNSVNCNLYHYAGNNPVKYTDPDGRFEVESPYQKNKNDPDNSRGYFVIPSCWNIWYTTYCRVLQDWIGKEFICTTTDNLSRDANIPFDRGYFVLSRRIHFSDGSFEYDYTGEYYPIADVLIAEDIRGPIADKMTFEIYTKLFGGIIKDNVLLTPKNQSYSQVRNRIGFIFGLVSYLISRKYNHCVFIEGITFSDEYYNLTSHEKELIISKIEEMKKNGELKYVEIE